MCVCVCGGGEEGQLHYKSKGFFENLKILTTNWKVVFEGFLKTVVRKHPELNLVGVEQLRFISVELSFPNLSCSRAGVELQKWF